MRLHVVLLALLGACMPPPPAVDPEAKHASPEASTPLPSPTTRPSIAASGEGGTPLAKSATTCPVATGRRTFCEGRKVCTRDQNGCEKCRCNSELDKDRARFEQTNPWDMRQR